MIEALEVEQTQLIARMSEGDFYRQGSGTIAAMMERLEMIERQLDESYQRWQELDTIGTR
jgi:hypothetical protein